MLRVARSLAEASVRLAPSALILIFDLSGRLLSQLLQSCLESERLKCRRERCVEENKVKFTERFMGVFI